MWITRNGIKETPSYKCHSHLFITPRVVVIPGSLLSWTNASLSSATGGFIVVLAILTSFVLLWLKTSVKTTIRKNAAKTLPLQNSDMNMWNILLNIFIKTLLCIEETFLQHKTPEVTVDFEVLSFMTDQAIVISRPFICLIHVEFHAKWSMQGRVPVSSRWHCCSVCCHIAMLGCLKLEADRTVITAPPVWLHVFVLPT